jgi:hypothetical protein
MLDRPSGGVCQIRALPKAARALAAIRCHEGVDGILTRLILLDRDGDGAGGGGQADGIGEDPGVSLDPCISPITRKSRSRRWSMAFQPGMGLQGRLAGAAPPDEDRAARKSRACIWHHPIGLGALSG